jgi:ankyrin repeat protein
MIKVLEQAIQHKNISYVKELLDNGVSINIDIIEEYKDDILSKTVRQAQPLGIIKLLLEYGANPVFVNSDGRTALSEAIAINRIDIASLLLKYGATVNISAVAHPYTLFFVQDQALMHAEMDMLELLLDNGADTCAQQDIDGLINDANDLSEYIWLNAHDSNKIAYLKQNRQMIEELLYAKAPPSLKLGEDTYIIYENKEIDEEIEIYLLADKQKYQDKKYLYADNKSDTFVYWCYKNELLSEAVMKLIEKYLTQFDVTQYKNLSKLIKEVMADKLTTEYFTEDEKDFATAYLTVTHWWYNLHTDFNRLYQEEEIKLPRDIQSQEEFDMLMKLLDIRHTQFKSGKDFNSNQNKEELQALIEGKEPPKRVVDLSFLEEKEESDTIQNNNTIPDDFMK